MIKKPILSIIIPVHRSEVFLEKCLKSVLTEKTILLEVIVVNDGPSQECKTIINKFIRDDSRVKLINNQKNMGSLNSRIIGFKESQGEYIAFLDADDELSNLFYRELIAQAKDSDSDIIIGNSALKKHRSFNVVANIDCPPNKLICNNNASLRKHLFDSKGQFYFWYVFWNKIYKRNLVENAFNIISLYKMIPKVMADDVLFSIIIFSLAKNAWFCQNNEYYCYNMSQNSVSKIANSDNFTRSLQNCLDIIRAFAISKKFLIKSNLYHFHRSQLKDWKHRLTREWLRIFQSNQKLKKLQKIFLQLLLRTTMLYFGPQSAKVDGSYYKFLIKFNPKKENLSEIINYKKTSFFFSND